jgi:hypothetical protein
VVEQTSWTIEYFAQTNPAGDDQDDVPALLRRVADSVEKLGSIDVIDIILHTEITDTVDRPSLTVYFRRREE